jgi:Fe2+ or Zn2+ uptake regulation protein
MTSAAGSSKFLTCTQCGRIFNIIEDLNEHQRSEQQDQVDRNKEFIDG